MLRVIADEDTLQWPSQRVTLWAIANGDNLQARIQGGGGTGDMPPPLEHFNVFFNLRNLHGFMKVFIKKL